eukprot:NODE_14142_length_1126_cov_3.501502.p1 GENE.NODE_14142_length_1126_cov_3.501502~~NODE_14142_length_1126_cov_3.501502.p1  ORF type:complete len:193 (-),score=27.72 NODE_14142_length_1126_cov_3.501502:361-939(-)
MGSRERPPPSASHAESGLKEPRSVVLQYDGRSFEFGWEAGTSARDFAGQLQQAVRCITGLHSLEGVKMQSGSPDAAVKGTAAVGAAETPAAEVAAEAPAEGAEQLAVTPAAQTPAVLPSVTPRDIFEGRVPRVHITTPPMAATRIRGSASMASLGGFALVSLRSRQQIWRGRRAPKAMWRAVQLRGGVCPRT